MLHWIALLFGILTVVAICGVVIDEVRSRISDPAGPSPLKGIRFLEIVIVAVPITLAIIAGIEAYRILFD